MTETRGWDVRIVHPNGGETLLGGSETYAEVVERMAQLGRDRKWLPPAVPCALDRLLQAADQVLDDMQDGTSCCPAARDALRDALVPFRARLAEIDGVPLPAAPCADEVEVVARGLMESALWKGAFDISDQYAGQVAERSVWRKHAQAALAALAPLRQAERERAWRDGADFARGELAEGLCRYVAPPAQPPMGGPDEH